MDSIQFNKYVREVSSFKANARSQYVRKEKDQGNEQVLKDQRSQQEQRVKKLYSRVKMENGEN